MFPILRNREGRAGKNARWQRVLGRVRQAKGAKYRAAAGLSEFKHWLKNAARKTGTVVVDPDEEKRKKNLRKSPVISASESGCVDQGTYTEAKVLKAGA